MPNSTSTRELEYPFHNTTLGDNDEEIYQDEDPIDPNDVPSDVRTFLAEPYNVEMMEKSIRANKTKIFLNLVKDGVNVPPSFDENALFRQITKGGAPMLTTSNAAPTSSKGKETMVITSAMPTSSTSTQPTFQLSVEHIHQIISAMPNVTTHASIPQSTLTTSTMECLGIGKVPTQPMAMPTQPMHSSYLQVPTTMVKTFVRISTTAYQYIGQSGVPPSPHTTFGTPYNLGGGFVNSQQSQVQPLQDLAQQFQELWNLVLNMNKKGVKDVSFNEICPFPFDKSINMVPFLTSFEIHKFDKYMRETCPITYLKEFSILCQEVAYSDDYLKRLFAWSLGGPTLEWLMNLPKGSFTSFNDLTSNFIAQYSYNIEQSCPFKWPMQHKTTKWRNFC